MRRVVLPIVVAGGLIACLVDPGAVASGVASVSRSPAEYLKEATERADALYEKSDWEAARRAYGRVLFANPRDSKAKKRLAEINTKFAESVIEVVGATWEKDTEKATKLLWQAHRADPQGKAVTAALKESGYVYAGGQWLRAEVRKDFAKYDRERGEKRREEIGLDGSFKIIRRGVFRFFTDLEGGARKLAVMMTAIETHYETYLQFMALLGPRYPTEGLDVVLFSDVESYKRVTEDDGSAVGLYIPARGASYFYLTGAGDDFNTLLHEMTHQLNDKVIEAWAMPAWFEEGIAEYFGVAEIKSGGKRIELGRATGYRLTDFLESVRTRDREPIPLAAFLDGRTDGFDGAQFYAQGWALVHYLLHGPAPGRMIAFDILAGSVDNVWEGTPDIDAKWIESMLATYALDMETFEEDFHATYREGRIK